MNFKIKMRDKKVFKPNNYNPKTCHSFKDSYFPDLNMVIYVATPRP